MNDECRQHGLDFDDEVGYFCPRCGELFDPDDVRQRIADHATETGMQGSEGLMGPDGRIYMSADPDAIDLGDDPEMVAAFVAAIEAGPLPVRWTYLAWTCCPGRDWAEPPSLACRRRGSRYRRCEAERPRRLRACVRAHPSDGPPAAPAGIGSVRVIDP